MALQIKFLLKGKTVLVLLCHILHPLLPWKLFLIAISKDESGINLQVLICSKILYSNLSISRGNPLNILHHLY